MAGKRKIDIIGVPLDLGVKELGLKLGPDGFREAGLAEVFRRLEFDCRDLGNIEIRGSRDGGGSRDDQVIHIARSCADLAALVGESIRAGRLPICLGGDHSLAIGSVAGASSQVGRLGCIWIDAHPDANTPATSPSGNIHGMPVAIALGHGPEPLVNLGRSGPKVAYENMSVLGASDIDPGEWEFIRQHDIQLFTVFDILEQGLPHALQQVTRRVTAGTQGVHVSFDLDVLREDIAPGVGIVSSCGLDRREAAYMCQHIAANCPIVSIDCVGLNPVRDRDMRTVRCAIELLLSLLGEQFSFSYDEYLTKQRGN